MPVFPAPPRPRTLVPTLISDPTPHTARASCAPSPGPTDGGLWASKRAWQLLKRCSRPPLGREGPGDPRLLAVSRTRLAAPRSALLVWEPHQPERGGVGWGGEAPPPAERRGGPRGARTFPAPRATLLPKARSPSVPVPAGRCEEPGPQRRGPPAPAGPPRPDATPKMAPGAHAPPRPHRAGPKPPNQLVLFPASGESSPRTAAHVISAAGQAREWGLGAGSAHTSCWDGLGLNCLSRAVWPTHLPGGLHLSGASFQGIRQRHGHWGVQPVPGRVPRPPQPLPAEGRARTPLTRQADTPGGRRAVWMGSGAQEEAFPGLAGRGPGHIHSAAFLVCQARSDLERPSLYPL